MQLYKQLYFFQFWFYYYKYKHSTLTDDQMQAVSKAL